MHNIFWRNVATQGAVGYGTAPGTVATCMMIPLVFFLGGLQLSFGSAALMACAFVAFGWYVAARALPFFHEPDPAPIVIDEAVSFVALSLFLPANVKTIIIAALLFRLFDILKPLGIRYLERLPGAAGIMLDDLAAAGMAYLIIRVLMYGRYLP
jgi:phosphatidylglycerophosphatase A